MEKLELRDLEQLLVTLPGVCKSHIAVGKSGSIDEIHVLANRQRSAKQLIRDIETVFLTELELKIDRKIISIAQIDDDGLEVKSHRLGINRVEYAKYDIYSGKAEVYLTYIDKLLKGEAEGIQPSNQINRLVAKATLKAVEMYFEERVKFSLDDISLVNISNKNIILSSVYLLNGKEEKLLVGNSILKGDINLAIVKSVLDAVNRFIR